MVESRFVVNVVGPALVRRAFSVEMVLIFGKFTLFAKICQSDSHTKQRLSLCVRTRRWSREKAGLL